MNSFKTNCIYPAYDGYEKYYPYILSGTVKASFPVRNIVAE
jgi:hypothetical protein